jgi:hypothetical protein
MQLDEGEDFVAPAGVIAERSAERVAPEEETTPQAPIESGGRTETGSEIDS